VRPTIAFTAEDGAVTQALADTAEIAASRERVHSRLLGRERVVTLFLAGGFLAVAVVCALAVPSDTPFSLPRAALLVALFALASQIEFEIGPGSAVPTELVLVPMLFVLPAGIVPLAVALGLLVGGCAERLRSQRHGERVAVLVCSAWHSVGPALVVGFLASGPPAWSRAPLYLLALPAQFALDSASVLLRHRLGRRVPLSRLLPPLGWVATVDAALAPVALLVAFVAVEQPAAALAVLPLAGLLHLLGIDRQRRIDESLVLGRAVLDASRAARSDPLTGTGNRLAWQEAIEAAERDDAGHISVILVDLDRLKETNDRYGHDAGDRLIQTLARALQAVVPEATTLARIGGDEFAILALELDDSARAGIVARIRDELDHLVVSGVPVAASIGAASCPPCASLADALRLADERLYADKAGLAA
jgi:diguanylate cyclase (GGDEF)-like protein